MKGILCILLTCFLFATSFGQRPAKDIPASDTIPRKAKEILPLPLSIKMPEKKDTGIQAGSRNLLVFPFLVRSLETSWGFGGIAARFFKLQKGDTTIRTSDVNILALYTLNKQLITAINSTLFFPREDKIARFQASYSYYPDKFWGLGNHTSEDAGENFTQRQFFINPQFLVRVHKKLYVGFSYEYQHSGQVYYSHGGVFDQENITGRYGGNTSGVGPLLSWDTRNRAYSPDKGIFAELQYLWFDKSIGSSWNFTVFNADFRKYLALTPKSVLAFQGVAGFTNGNTPFRKLEELGGSDMMRGYYGGRYTDKCLMAYQAEYRQFLFWRLGIVGFASTGEVSPDLQHFELDGFHFSYGGGLRLMISKEEKLNIRVDYGIGSHNNNGFYVQLREAF